MCPSTWGEVESRMIDRQIFICSVQIKEEESEGFSCSSVHLWLKFCPKILALPSMTYFLLLHSAVFRNKKYNYIWTIYDFPPSCAVSYP
jgi:hypothetical protein